MSNALSVTVQHNTQAQRFEATVSEQLCVCDYRMQGERTMALTHTEVPRALEGRGIASALVRAAFDHAKAHGLMILPLCSYVRTWAKRHPEVASLMRTE